jgi:hypothetical protein
MVTDPETSAADPSRKSADDRAEVGEACGDGCFVLRYPSQPGKLKNASTCMSRERISSGNCVFSDVRKSEGFPDCMSYMQTISRRGRFGRSLHRVGFLRGPDHTLHPF